MTAQRDGDIFHTPLSRLYFSVLSYNICGKLEVCCHKVCLEYPMTASNSFIISSGEVSLIHYRLNPLLVDGYILPRSPNCLS